MKQFKKIESARLPIYFMRLPQVKSVSMGILVNVGTRDESWPKEAGISHALEHMVFRGTKKFVKSKDLTSFIEDVGGYMNAATYSEATFFYMTLPYFEMEKGFDVLSQMMLEPSFNRKDIQTEMQSIVEEIKMANDDPLDFSLTEFQKGLFGSHPLGRDILGLEDSVLSFTKFDFQSYLCRFYNYSNMSLLVVGNVSEEEVLKLTYKYFSKILISAKNVRKNIMSTISDYKMSVVERANIKQAKAVFGVTTCPAAHPDATTLGLYSVMLDGGMSFPFFQEIRDKKGLVYTISCGVDKNTDLSSFYIYLGADQKNLREAENLIFEIMEKSKTDEILLAKAKKLLLGKLLVSNESSGVILKNGAIQLTNLGRIPSVNEIVEKINKVDISQIKNAADKYLAKEKFVKFFLVPKKQK